MKESFIFFASFDEALRELPDKSRLKVYDAVCDYALRGIEADFNGIEKAIFTLIKAQIDRRNQRVENGKKGGRKKQDNLNHTLSILEPHLNQSSSEVKPHLTKKEKASPTREEAPKKESSKENIPQEESITLEREKERTNESNLNNYYQSAHTHEGDCYEDIISHYAGTIDVETKAAVWDYIKFFQAKTGCFILNKQLKVFLRNLKKNGLLFQGGVKACMNDDGISMAMQEMS